MHVKHLPTPFFVLESILRNNKVSVLFCSANVFTFPLQACKLKLGDLKGALLDADFAIRDADDNVKAFYRQSQVSGFSSFN